MLAAHIGAFLQTRAPVLDKLSGPMGAQFLSSTGLGTGNLLGRAQVPPAPALDKNRSETGLCTPPLEGKNLTVAGTVEICNTPGLGCQHSFSLPSTWQILKLQGEPSACLHTASLLYTSSKRKDIPGGMDELEEAHLHQTNSRQLTFKVGC